MSTGSWRGFGNCLDVLSGPWCLVWVSDYDFSHVLAVPIQGWHPAFSSCLWVDLSEAVITHHQQGPTPSRGLESWRHLWMPPAHLWETLFLWMESGAFFLHREYTNSAQHVSPQAEPENTELQPTYKDNFFKSFNESLLITDTNRVHCGIFIFIMYFD